MDRVLSGGAVPGKAVAIYGEPGIGKSTLIGQWAGGVAELGAVLYTSGEEAQGEILRRQARTESQHDDLYITEDCTVKGIIESATRIGAVAVVVDSLQTLVVNGHRPGSVSSVVLGLAELSAWAKQGSVSVLFVFQVVADGQMAGPKTLEHAVDAVLEFEATKGDGRRLKAKKNRNGAQQTARMRMGPKGLVS